MEKLLPTERTKIKFLRRMPIGLIEFLNGRVYRVKRRNIRDICLKHMHRCDWPDKRTNFTCHASPK